MVDIDGGDSVDGCRLYKLLGLFRREQRLLSTVREASDLAGCIRKDNVEVTGYDVEPDQTGRRRKRRV